MTVIYARMADRRDNTANWGIADPILAAGEIGVEIVSPAVVYFKLGDGVTAWSALPYSNGGVPIGPTVLGTRTTPINVSEPIAAPVSGDTLLFAQGNGGNVSVDNIGAGSVVGAKLRLQVATAAKQITLTASGNIKVNGGSVTLGLQAPLVSIFDLHYDGLYWVEDGRNGI